MAERKPQRLFTLVEATALLPLVKRLLTRIQERKRELDALSAALDEVLASTNRNGHMLGDVANGRRAVADAGTVLQSAMAELDATGVELKGIEEGLVDFRSRREDRVVYLCWRQGEEAIEWWHELNTGVAGRQPL